MNINAKLLVFIIGLVLIIDIIIIDIIHPPAVSWTEFRGDGFTCTVPGGQRTYREENGWKKNIFSDYGLMYISTFPLSGNPDSALSDLRKYLKPVYEKEIRIIENGHFFLEKAGKNLKYVYLFTAGNTIFWLENSSAHSPLRFYKDILDDVVRSISVGSRSISSDFETTTEQINSDIILYAQSEPVFIAFLLAISILPVLLIVSILSLISRSARKKLTEKYKGQYILIVEGAVVTKCSKLPCVILLLNDRIVYSSFRKEHEIFLSSITKAEEKTSLKLKWRREWYWGMKVLEIHHAAGTTYLIIPKDRIAEWISRINIAPH
jgi:hypothetical protein